MSRTCTRDTYFCVASRPRTRGPAATSRATSGHRTTLMPCDGSKRDRSSRRPVVVIEKYALGGWYEQRGGPHFQENKRALALDCGNRRCGRRVVASKTRRPKKTLVPASYAIPDGRPAAACDALPKVAVVMPRTVHCRDPAETDRAALRSIDWTRPSGSGSFRALRGANRGG
jgi:hypothetical protein